MSTFRKATGAILANSAPVSGVNVDFYSTGTWDHIDLYSDAAGSTPESNPLTTDSSGRYACFIDVALNETFRIYLTKSGVDFDDENADLDGISLPGTGADNWADYPADSSVDIDGYDINMGNGNIDDLYSIDGGGDDIYFYDDINLDGNSIKNAVLDGGSA